MRTLLPFAAAVALTVVTGTALAAAPKPTGTIRLDKSFSIPLDNECRYNARVRGDIRPNKAERTTGETVVDPDLVVNADLQCADQATLLLPQRVQQPMTWEELEQTIDDRAVLTSADGRDQCEYMPEFNLSGAGLNLRDVSYRCPMP
jgi:hypothetical protein